MIETLKSNKWKIVAIFIAIVAVIFYLYPKKEEIPSEEDSDNKVLEFNKEEKEEND